jgi:hypothetical protein
VLTNLLSCCNQVKMSIDSIKVTQFGGKSSFSAFKHKVLAYLQTLGLKDIVVSGTETRGASSNNSSSSSSSSSSSKRSVEEVSTKSERAYAILLNLLSDEVIDLVAHVEAGDAHGVWTVLLETYETKSTASLCYTLDQFMNIKFDDDRESFDVYKAKFMNLLVSLKEMGEVVSVAIQRYVILRGLPSTYEALVQSLKINDKLSMEETYIHIKDYYEMQKRMHDREDKSNSHAYAMVGRRNGDRRDCYICGHTDHLIRNCPLRNKLMCTKCNKKGHVSRYCNSRDTAGRDVDIGDQGDVVNL